MQTDYSAIRRNYGEVVIKKKSILNRKKAAGRAKAASAGEKD